MIDLHCHTLFSDGELLPAELVQRAQDMGHKAIAMTDHVDSSNLDFVLPRLLKVAKDLNKHHTTKALAGVELTHVPPAMIAELTLQAKKMGAQVVVVHGETLAEPVAQGTNQAALEAKVDILAHPGLLTKEQALLAAKNNVMLELSARKGHCLANGRVASLALATNAKLVVNTDTHAPTDLINQNKAGKVALGAGVLPGQLKEIFNNSEIFVNKVLSEGLK